MERFRSFARLLAVNIGVVVGLLVVTNLASGLAIAASDALAGNSGDAGDPRASLPNYSDRARAELMFQELHRLKAVYAPFEEWTLEPFAGQTTTVDVHGNRVQPNAPTLPNDATVVHFFGGSTMFGTGSEDGETIPAQFAKLNAGIRVKNHGRSGFDTRQSLEQLISLLNLDERLDVAVFYLGVNDVASLCRRDTSVNGHEQEARMRELLDAPSSESGWANALYRPLLSNTAVLAGKVARAIKRATTSPASTPVYRCADDPDHARAVADTVERNLLAARALVTSSGGRLLALLQPVAYFGGPTLDHLKGDLSPIPGLRAQYEAVYPLLRERAAKTDWWTDDTDAFDGGDRLYIDYCHVSPNGNARMALRIDAYIRRSGAAGRDG